VASQLLHPAVPQSSTPAADDLADPGCDVCRHCCRFYLKTGARDRYCGDCAPVMAEVDQVYDEVYQRYVRNRRRRITSERGLTVRQVQVIKLQAHFAARAASAARQIEIDPLARRPSPEDRHRSPGILVIVESLLNLSDQLFRLRQARSLQTNRPWPLGPRKPE